MNADSKPPSDAGPGDRHDSAIDALALIEGDLDHLQRDRRRHFVPAAVLAVFTVVASLFVLGVRPDLSQLPPLQVAAQVALWAMCLLVLPAVGLGLAFPGRATKVGLVSATVALAVAASLGWDPEHHHLHAMRWGIGHCFVIQMFIGAALLGVAAVSGAFLQRRRPSAVIWVAAALALAAMNTATWFCPAGGIEHVAPSHFMAACVLVVLTGAAGWGLHRRNEARA